MKYRVIATECGPEIRFNDWKAYEGYVAPARGEVQVHSDSPGRAHVINEFCSLGGGGDIEYELVFRPDRIGADGKFSLCFNRQYRARRVAPGLRGPDPEKPGGGDAGLRLEVTPGRLTFFRAGREVWSRPVAAGDLERPHTIKVATLLWEFVAELDGQGIAAGGWNADTKINEGRTVVLAEDADVTISDYSQQYIRRDAAFPEWRRGDLLYEESFGRASFEENWFTNGAEPTVDDKGFAFHVMSNSFLRRRFDAPVAVECVATPQPSPKHSSIVTDAIFMWMADRADGDLFEYLAGLEDAELGNLVPLNLYWVDLGGSNNVTTRLRRNPGRILVRQFSDRPHLLVPGASYRTTSAVSGNSVEFWVDGERWIETWDPDPHSSGFVGFRAFAAGIKVTELKVWSIS